MSRFFCIKVLRTPFLFSQFVFFGGRKLSKKLLRKMLVKLTTGLILCQTFCVDCDKNLNGFKQNILKHKSLEAVILVIYFN